MSRLNTQRQINHTRAAIDAAIQVRDAANDQLDALALRLVTLKMLQAEENTEHSLKPVELIKFIEIA